LSAVLRSLRTAILSICPAGRYERDERRSEAKPKSLALLAVVITRRAGGGARGGGRRSDARGPHHAVDRLDGFGGGLEVAGADTFRDHERRPAVLILLVPDVDFRPLVGEELDHLGQALIG